MGSRTPGVNARAEGWLEADRQSVGLNGDGIRVDVDRFRELLAECRTHGHPEAEVCPECLSPLSEAVALYRDDFLAGFALRDSAVDAPSSIVLSHASGAIEQSSTWRDLEFQG